MQPSSPASLSALAPPGRTPVRSVVDVSPLGGCVPWRIATGDQRQLGSASTSADSKFTGKYSFEVDQGRIWGSGVAAAFLRILLCRCGATWRVPGRRLTKIDTVGCKQHTNAYACSLASHYGASERKGLENGVRGISKGVHEGAASCGRHSRRHLAGRLPGMCSRGFEH